MSKSRFFRHPGILPSVTSNLISHVFQADGREFSVNDLLAWSDPIPRESVAEEIRAQFVVRIRNAAERLWILPACISLEPGWHDVVHGDDKERLLAFVASMTSPQDFVKLTMREIKEGLRLPLLRVLRILARLESIYWVPGPRAMRVEELVAWDPQQRVEISAQKRQELLKLANSLGFRRWPGTTSGFHRSMSGVWAHGWSTSHARKNFPCDNRSCAIEC